MQINLTKKVFEKGQIKKIINHVFVGFGVKKRKKNNLKEQILTGKIYVDHKQGKDKSFYDVHLGTKPTKYTRKDIGLFLIWIWGFILGFPLSLSFFSSKSVDTFSTLLSIFGISTILFAWISLWIIGRQKHYFQEIFDSFDYTYHPSTFDQVDDMRLFKIEEKMSIARENNDIEKITEYRYNIKQLALKGQLSKQTKEYIKEKYYYLGID